ncbi:hypothetical protein ACOT81_33770 [Streptomyces sp. WI04-05B]|uniref:hypothetical protein n=1 Tax=Streptomyces TaxID=1883 RepID=UPI0029BCB22F|nr:MULTISPECIES: hypothetical protein [unclassified Streptomyces]MDX2541833.1 hypothetical protein [Streptomyces sp. WI04-05B]MDX2586915.1 hypothetical protein [Streptomyces sp. WI04-05A]MDX3749883.1 hypothetical protein [Streptomyces sp. AK08-02]
MFEHEIQLTRSAQLRREAADERLAREAVRAARAARREAAGRAAEGEVHPDDTRRHWFTRAA